MNRISETVFIIFFPMMLILGCNGRNKTESGIEYRILHKGSDKKPIAGSIIHLHYRFTDGEGMPFTIEGSSTDSVLMEYIPGNFKMIYDVIGALHEGDSAVAMLPADSVYIKLFNKSNPSFAAEANKLKWFIKIKKIYSREEMKQILDQRLLDSYKREDNMIRDYLLKNGIGVMPGKSGIVYISFREGSGIQPVKNDVVTVQYTGRFLNGEVFDSSEDGRGSVTFTMGSGKMIKGWEEGIGLMKEKGLSRLVIPSRMAYGIKGYGPIPPNTPVVYDVELIKVARSETVSKD